MQPGTDEQCKTAPATDKGCDKGDAAAAPAIQTTDVPTAAATGATAAVSTSQSVDDLLAEIMGGEQQKQSELEEQESSANDSTGAAFQDDSGFDDELQKSVEIDASTIHSATRLQPALHC